MNISEMLARNGRTHPDHVALIERSSKADERRQVTWKEFDDAVNRIANGLMAKGIRKGDKVLHWMMNSINWLQAYLGIVRTGAWAIPLNFRFTGPELKYCVDVAKPKAMILDEEFVTRVEEVRDGLTSIRDYIVEGQKAHRGMEPFEVFASEASSEPVSVEIFDEDICGLYFTSGTTGTPKPILLTHKNMECAAITEVVHGLRHPEDIFIILKPLYHTGDKIHWLSSLILGIPAVIQRGKITPRAIFEAIHDERGTVAMLLVPWIQDILGDLEKGSLNKEDYDLSSWRLVLLGAQPVPPSLVQRWNSLFPDMQYEINYGLTEASGPGCIHLGIGNLHKLGSLGKPGFNWEARLLDNKGRDVKKGEIGEIAVRGNGVMKGYYGNSEETANVLKSGWLLTGDLGRKDDDGFIWPCDRKKDIIIYGGENIYPSEIETVLQTHPAVHDVGVLGVLDDRLGEVVAAVIDLEPEMPEFVKKEIDQFCEDKLPRYKRPRRIVFNRVLRNPLGKIDKNMMRKAYF